MTPTPTPRSTRRTYRGLNQREDAGWVLGLTPLRALGCVVLAAPVLMAVSAGRWTQTLAWLAVDGPLAVLLVVPVRGRPALRWLGDLVLFQVGVLTGWSTWQSRAAAGTPGDPGEPDLPGAVTRLRFPDGPVFGDRGRVCLVHDPAAGRWGATAQLSHGGTGMLSAADCDRLAARFGALLDRTAHRGLVDRLSFYVRTGPDDGAEYAHWRARHTHDAAPPLAHRATAELDRAIGAVSLSSEVYVCVSGREDALRTPADGAGGGLDGRARVLYRALDGVEDALRALGVGRVTWLDSPRMAVALRTGYNPAAAAGLSAEALRDGHGTTGLPLIAAGPTLAPTPAARAYHHDGFTTVTYAVLMPEHGLGFGALGPLLAVRRAGERRTVAVHYEILDARASAAAVQRRRFRTGVVRDLRSSRGFIITAADQRAAGGARDQEHAVAAGAALVRFGVAAAVTVPAEWPVEDHAAWLENDAAAGTRLLRLELAQDSAFVAAVLPVGVGLPRRRGARS